MPTNVRRFIWLWWGHLAIALVQIPLLPPPNPAVTRSAQMAVMAGVFAITVAVLLPFFWLAVWRRKNWARWLLLVVFVASNPIFLIPSWTQLPPLIIGMGCLSLLMEAAAFYFLFTGDARGWFKVQS